MKIRTWPFLLIGFGALLVLIGISAVAVERRIGQVRSDVTKLQVEELRADSLFDELRANIYLFAVLLRDYVLEPSTARAEDLRQSILQLRESTRTQYAGLMEQETADEDQLRQLLAAIEDYWTTAEPVLNWDASRRAIQGPEYILRNVSPKRDVAFALADRVELLRRSESQARQHQIQEAQQSLRDYLIYATIATLVLGSLVAAGSIIRTQSLESNAEQLLEISEQSAADLRRLSSKLSKAQEDERRSISRELHDQVGQTLTALRLELGNLATLRRDEGKLFEDHLTEARSLADETLRTVRDISVGLRPSVLDELGLGPALRWQAREFTRRTGVPIDLRLDGDLDHLEDIRRTGVYRLVQEALTNCARHAQATQILISVCGEEHEILVNVKDNGIGFDVASGRSQGLGLLGTEERVKELGGHLDITSARGRGTALNCRLPRVPENTV